MDSSVPSLETENVPSSPDDIPRTKPLFYEQGVVFLKIVVDQIPDNFKKVQFIAFAGTGVIL